MAMKKTAIFMIALAMPSILAAWAHGAEQFAVELRNIEDRKAVFATVESVDRITARARLGGIIEELSIDEGSQVEAGQQIAVIRDKKLPLTLAALNARLKSISAQQKLAETDLKRAKSLRKSGAGSQARLDEAQSRLDMFSSEAAAMNAEKSVILQQIKDGQVRAPAAGRVLSVPTASGSVIMPGETVAVIARDDYILRLRLPERHAKFMRVGDKVQVGARGMVAGGGELADATVQKVYPEMEAGRVIADVRASGLGTYFVGERTSVHVATGSRQAIVAPARFFFQRYGVTFARLKDGAEITLQLGQRLGGANGEVEILSGLKAGDILVAP